MHHASRYISVIPVLDSNFHLAFGNFINFKQSYTEQLGAQRMFYGVNETITELSHINNKLKLQLHSANWSIQLLHDNVGDLLSEWGGAVLTGNVTEKRLLEDISLLKQNQTLLQGNLTLLQASYAGLFESTQRTLQTLQLERICFVFGLLFTSSIIGYLVHLYLGVVREVT